MAIKFVKCLSTPYVAVYQGDKSIFYDGTREVSGQTYYYRTRGGVTTWYDSSGNVVPDPTDQL